MCITVVGSINYDVVASTEFYPERGQTIFGKQINYYSGGKGANQAVAVSRLGKPVQLIGCVGNDINGGNLINVLNNNNVDTTLVKISENSATGTSIIIVDRSAENTILVLKGANEDLFIEDIESVFNGDFNSKILLIQMEIPQKSVIKAMQLAKQRGMYVILDPAPAEGITDNKVLEYADIITPNRQETLHLVGIDVTDIDSALQAGKAFDSMGVKNSIIKMGDRGSVVYQSGVWEYIESVYVEAVDTVGAGDSFAGALACGIADGYDLVSAVKFATIVGALKVTKFGAQSVPTRKEVANFCEERGLKNYLPQMF